MGHKPFVESEYFAPVFTALIWLAAALFLLILFDNNLTKLEHLMAREISIKEQLLEEQQRLRIELATLKSPHRIETIARERSRMYYPGKSQYIRLR
jgi:cell division protein FtsL